MFPIPPRRTSRRSQPLETRMFAACLTGPQLRPLRRRPWRLDERHNPCPWRARRDINSGSSISSRTRRRTRHSSERKLFAFHVGGVESLRSLLALEGYAFAFVQRFVALILNRREVYEYVLAGGTLDKSITL